MKSVILQPRDLALFRELFESRLMTLAHITTLFFDGKIPAAQRRTYDLQLAGYLTKRERRVGEAPIYGITKRAFTALADAEILAEYPSISWSQLEGRLAVAESTLRHELAVMDVKTAFIPAIRNTLDAEIVEFVTWPLLCEFTALVQRPGGIGSEETKIRPDGFFHVIEREPGDGESDVFCFLELDRGSETLDTLVGKATGYQDYYYQRGGLAPSFGDPPSKFHEYPFRVLAVVQSIDRRNNYAAMLFGHRHPVKAMVWITTITELLADPLGPIWLRPIDYHRATTGTPHAAFPAQPHSRMKTPRNSARDQHVAKAATLHRLFDDPAQ